MCERHSATHSTKHTRQSSAECQGMRGHKFDHRITSSEHNRSDQRAKNTRSARITEERSARRCIRTSIVAWRAEICVANTAMPNTMMNMTNILDSVVLGVNSPYLRSRSKATQERMRYGNVQQPERHDATGMGRPLHTHSLKRQQAGTYPMVASVTIVK